jgi:hypothetical protein
MVDFKDISLEGFVADVRDWWWDVVNTVMNLRIPLM